MKVSIIAVGKIRESYLKDAAAEYIKRLSAWTSVQVIEVKEDERILPRIPPNAFVYVLAVNGKRMSSQVFSKHLEENMLNGFSHLAFIIGGHNGLCTEVQQAGDISLSFSDMTFPHQLMRVILLEQIYRCFKIINNEPYHK